MNKILIIDRDSSTLNDISRLLTALKFEPIVAFNSSSVVGIIRDEIAGIFIDVESKIISAEDIIKYFNGPQKITNNNVIPVFLMYSNDESAHVEHAKKLLHTEMIKKPFTLESIFNILYQHLNLNEFQYEQFSNRYKLEQLKSYSVSLSGWLEKLGSLLEHN